MKRLLIVTLALVMFVGAVAVALFYKTASPNADIAAGNQAFDAKDYASALEHYGAAQVHAPTQPEPIYNAANTLYREGTLDKAQQALEQAAAHPDEAIAEFVHFNLGNIAYNNKKFDAAIAQFEDALRVKPEDKDAKHNLELALLQKQPQDQQKQQNKDQQNQQQNQDQQNKDQQNKDQQNQQNKDQQNQQNQNQQNQQDQNQQNQDQQNKDQQNQQNQDQKNPQNQDQQNKDQQNKDQQNKDQQNQNQQDQQKQDQQNQQNQQQNGQQDQQQNQNQQNQQNPQQNGEQGNPQDQQQQQQAGGTGTPTDQPPQGQAAGAVPQQGLTPDQAKQLLAAVGGNSQTLMEKLQMYLYAPGGDPDKDW